MSGFEPKNVAGYLIIITILFHFFSYAFTIYGVDYTDYNIALEIEDLYISGIMIGEFDEKNVSYLSDGSDFYEFSINESDMRVHWYNIPLVGDAFAFQRKAPFFGFTVWQDLKIQDYNVDPYVLNQTVIEFWEGPIRNYSRFHSPQGLVIFFTDPLKQGNISRAVMDDGNVTITIAEDLGWREDMNLRNFVSWYIGLVTGSDTWGLPAFFTLAIQIMTTIGFFSAIFLLKELLRV